ncbi:MAG: efflux transporter outer membrane subunit [Alphaproteobacteria bacterium]|nr:efflux transporter outer membrane subunit [Alphaproteobacteria bacterium]
MSTLRLTLIAGAIGAGLAACTVGPDFHRPDPPKDQAYLPPEEAIAETASINVLGGEAQTFVRDMEIPASWWQVYASPQLDSLIQRSLAANPDIQAAIQSLKLAQQNARAQRAALFPTVSAQGSGVQTQTSAALAPVPANGNSIFGLFSGLINVAYVFDVFGGVRRQSESLDAQAEQQCFLLEAAYLTLSSNVVVAAITEASLRGQIEAIQRTIEVQRESLALLQRRMAIGQGALADVAAQQAALAQSEALLPPLQNQLSQQRHLLAQLTGQTTAHIPAETFQLDALTLPQQLPVSLPARMIEQRPDVRAAEANVHAAAAGVGVAISNMLPQFTFSLSAGSQTLTLGDLFDPVAGIASTVGLSITQPIVDGGALLARRRAADAAWEQAKAQYRSTVLTAFRNVADTMRQIEFDAKTLKAASDAEAAAKLSLDITRRRLASGDAGVLDILNAQLAYQQTVATRVQAQAARFSDTAALYQALGGGWWNRDPEGNATPAKRATCKAPKNPPKPQPWPGPRAEPIASAPGAAK